MTSRGVRIPLIVAIAWSAALIPAALYLPIEDPQNFAYQLHGKTIYQWISLTRDNGAGILWIPIVTLALVLVAAFFLVLQTRSGSRVTSRVATGVGVVILIGAIAGTITFLIGIFLAPSAVLVIVASATSRHGQALSRNTLECRCGYEGDASSQFCGSCGEPFRTSLD
jgi:hypothetical protein